MNEIEEIIGPTFVGPVNAWGHRTSIDPTTPESKRWRERLLQIPESFEEQAP